MLAAFANGGKIVTPKIIKEKLVDGRVEATADKTLAHFLSSRDSKYINVWDETGDPRGKRYRAVCTE